MKHWDVEATQLIIQKKFKENGLPKAIFLDFSSIFLPEIASELLWHRVHTYIKEYMSCYESYFRTSNFIIYISFCIKTLFFNIKESLII